MKPHKKIAVATATITWALLTICPYVIGVLFPETGLREKPFAFFGFVLGAMIWFQVMFTADASRDYRFLDFSFLLTLTAMASFVTLTGTALFSASVTSVDGSLSLPNSVFYYFAGVLLSFASAYASTWVMQADAEPGALIRFGVILSSISVFLLYVWSMMTYVAV